MKNVIILNWHKVHLKKASYAVSWSTKSISGRNFVTDQILFNLK